MPSLSLPREREFKFNDKKYTVKRMTLGQYAKFMEALEGLIPNRERLATLIEGATADRFDVVMDLLKTAPNKIADLAQIASGIPAKDVLDAYPEEIFELGRQVYDINNMKELGDRIKKALSLGQPQAQVKVH